MPVKNLSRRTALAAARRTRLVGDEGMTLIEVMAAFVVLAIMSTAIIAGLNTAVKASRTSRLRTAATDIAQQQIEIARNAGWANVSLGSSTSTVGSFTVKKTTSLSASASGTTDACSGSGAAIYKRVSISVTWPNIGNVSPARTDTVLAPQSGNVDPNSITVPIKLVKADGVTGQEGIPVSLSTSPPTTTITDSTGCALFGNVPAASYSATISASGYVDGQGNSTHVEAGLGSSIAGTRVPTTTIRYDQPASMTFTHVGSQAGYVPPTGLGETVRNVNLSGTTGTLAVPGTSISTLFPYADGYSVWSGTCSDANPSGYAGGTTPPSTVVPAGGAATVTVTDRAVGVTVLKGTTPVSGATVYAVHMSTVGCAAQIDPKTGLQVTDPGGTATVGAVITVGTTAADGTLKTALPLGTWQFEVAGGKAAVSWPSGTITPTSSNAISVVTK